MTSAFINRLLREGVVDTRKYRYVLDDNGHETTIKRLPVELLDTTGALTEWEIVWRRER